MLRLTPRRPLARSTRRSHHYPKKFRGALKRTEAKEIEKRNQEMVHRVLDTTSFYKGYNGNHQIPLDYLGLGLIVDQVRCQMAISSGIWYLDLNSQIWAIWKECAVIVQTTKPLIRVLRIVDSDDRSTMGYLEGMCSYCTNR